MAVAIADSNREFRIAKDRGKGIGMTIANSASGQGVRVIGLKDGGKAQQAGLAVGDLIVMIDRIPVSEHAEAIELIDTEKADVTIMTKGFHRAVRMNWRGTSEQRAVSCTQIPRAFNGSACGLVGSYIDVRRPYHGDGVVVTELKESRAPMLSGDQVAPERSSVDSNGLVIGDEIIAIDGEFVTSSRDARRLLSQA
jgi:predicted metalloprotease with PDZ domain